MLAAFLIAAAGPAAAQTRPAYAVGLDIARSRFYADPACYAAVFARHAVLVEKRDGRTGWVAASTPAYNAEQRRRCGIDRMAEMRREAPPAANRMSADPQGPGGAYRQGLRIARQRGFSGGQAECVARIFVRHATLRPSPYRAGVVDWHARSGPALRREMFSACGASI